MQFYMIVDGYEKDKLLIKLVIDETNGRHMARKLIVHHDKRH